MRVSLFVLLAALAVNALVDWYIWYQARHRLAATSPWPGVQRWSALGCALLLVAVMILPARKGDNMVLLWKMWLLYGYLTIYLAKYIWLVFDLIASIPRLFHRRRIPVLPAAGGVVAVVWFGAMWWGALVNRFHLQVNEVDVPIAGLPAEFDGYRVVQFSDLHVGTYCGDTAFVSRLVDRVNSLRPDVVVFTGDIVNRESAEMQPFVPVLRRLKARDGVFAILGNHDYGDYRNWASERAKQENMVELYRYFRQAGIRLLLNETVMLRHGSDSLALIGVENIGDPPFRIYGSLERAYPDTSDDVCKILLTHNPVHWTDSVAPHPDVRIPLTLSGHTHAMQMEIAGLSPSAFRYPTWGGLYQEAPSVASVAPVQGSQAAHASHTTPGEPPKWLYVNIGAGTVGFPARVGATPEITLITLTPWKPQNRYHNP